MQTLSLDYAAAAPAARRALAGVVGSGDLEVLLEPAEHGRSTVEVHTSVDGVNDIWKAVIDRIFLDGRQPAVALEINDFGATPAVVRLRIAQAMELAMHKTTDADIGGGA